MDVILTNLGIWLKALRSSNIDRGYLIKNMNIMSQDFSFRKGESNDIISLESCRIKSIENCKIYSEKQNLKKTTIFSLS